jgi:uncharacterized membrane protein YkvA (DUF1232 family)
MLANVATGQWILVAFAVSGATYLGFVIGLVLVGRRRAASALARFIPDCIVLFRRILVDARVSRPHKLLVGLLIAYLAMPFDVVPDFIPVAGQLDDAILVALALRTVLRASGAELVREHSPGPEQSLAFVLKLAGT